MSLPIPADPLIARLLALCRETDEVCSALEGVVAGWAETLARVETAHLGEFPVSLERTAAAVEHARRVNRKAEVRIAGGTTGTPRGGA